jgi:hypothetical protein
MNPGRRAAPVLTGHRGDGFKNEILKTHPNGLLGGLFHSDEVAKAQIGRNMKKIGLRDLEIRRFLENIFYASMHALCLKKRCVGYRFSELRKSKMYMISNAKTKLKSFCHTIFCQNRLFRPRFLYFCGINTPCACGGGKRKK